MDVRYFNPFIQGLTDVFAARMETDIFISKPFVRTELDHTIDVSAVIGVSGDAVGSVALCFPMKSAVAISSKFAGVKMTENHEDFADTLGDLANLVAEHAKSKLKGLSCSTSHPSVIVGKDIVISRSKTAPRLALPCDSPLGRFSVEVSITVKKKMTADA